MFSPSLKSYENTDVNGSLNRYILAVKTGKLTII